MLSGFSYSGGPFSSTLITILLRESLLYTQFRSHYCDRPRWKGMTIKERAAFGFCVGASNWFCGDQTNMRLGSPFLSAVSFRYYSNSPTNNQKVRRLTTIIGVDRQHLCKADRFLGRKFTTVLRVLGSVSTDFKSEYSYIEGNIAGYNAVSVLYL